MRWENLVVMIKVLVIRSRNFREGVATPAPALILMQVFSTLQNWYLVARISRYSSSIVYRKCRVYCRFQEAAPPGLVCVWIYGLQNG